MEQFYDLPQSNRRTQLLQFFQKCNTPKEKSQNLRQFRPYSQQRDKLGRLINHNQSLGVFAKRRRLSNHQGQERKNNPQMKRQKNALEMTVDKFFKVNGVKESQCSANFHKQSLQNLLGNTQKRPSTTAHHRRNISLKQRVQVQQRLIRTALSKPQSRSRKIRTAMKLDKTAKYLPFPQGNSQKQTTKQLQQIAQLQMNIPQLERFHSMKNLKTKIIPNLEDNHLRFKQLVRKGQILANTIKRNLQFDFW